MLACFGRMLLFYRPRKEVGEVKRNYDLKRRESGDLPPEKSQEILSRIYPEGTVNELMDKLFETDKQDHPTEKGGEW